MNKPISLVIRKRNEGEYVATGGELETLFSGAGQTLAEAIGSWMIANREAVGFQFSWIEDGEFKASKEYGRTRSTLGAYEQQALEEHRKIYPLLTGSEEVARMHCHPWTEREGWVTVQFTSKTHDIADRDATTMKACGWSVWIVSNSGCPGFVVYREAASQ